MNIKGILKRKGEVVQVNDNYSKRDFVVTIDHDKQYPQTVQFQLSQAKINLLDGIPLGSEIDVSFNLKGREYQDKQTGEPKVFTIIEAWSVKVISKTNAQAPNLPQQENLSSDTFHNSDSDLPF